MTAVCRLKTLSVCRFKTSPCVPAPRPHAEKQARAAGIHGDVLNLHTESVLSLHTGFSACHTTRHTQHHTTQLHTNTHDDTHHQHMETETVKEDGERRQRKKTEREKREERRKKRSEEKREEKRR